ncbi:non-ribosomal peptide synthetase [Streptomyces sp. NPDC051987]|uniref:non-ribosomal peptide synthetase n=1 Tax=Streptomyces sp. NPDC051987 TaxID=3155808 RepID=UPI00342C075E
MTTSLQTDLLSGPPASAAVPPDATRDPGHGIPLPRDGWEPVHERVARFARITPAAPAVSGADGTVGYRELHAWAGRIADRLAEAGVGRGSRVGILVPASTAMVATVLGVLRSEAAYVPVDPAHPDRRVAEVLADARVAAVVVTAATADRVTGLGLPVVRLEDTVAPTGNRTADDGEGGGASGDDTEDTDEEPAPAAGASRHATAAAGDHPAYLIYTSGSTGEPKGVEVGHRQLAASTLARRMVYPGSPVFLLVSPLAFDSSVAGLWGTLTAGGHLVVATADEVRDPARLLDLIEEHGVTRLLCVPSLYAVLLDAAERLGTHRITTLDTVITAGEPLPAPLMRRHFALHTGRVALVNEYGPTETTVWASFRRYLAPGPVSIGGPVPGVRLYVLDDRLRPVPRGTEGELFIGGAGVGNGYFGRPEATARAFVDDPFDAAPDARMYRTGDLVRWRDDGTLDFLGRRDHQVKVRGHRIELGAVEAALCELPEVREAVVVPDGTGTALTGFVLAPALPVGRDLRAELARTLPAPMVPARIEVLDTFPRTVNGKADRTALRSRAEQPHTPPRPAPPASGTAPVSAAAPTSAAPAANGTGTVVVSRETATGAAAGPTAAVAAAWAEVLKVADVPVDINFFDLGGHSLAMFQLQDALERHTGSRPAIVALFRHTTVAAQAALIRDGGADANDAEADARRAAARRARALRARRHHASEEPAK